jgi:hypothetical protein
LLLTYAFGLLLVGIIAAVRDSPTWFDLFKSGFLLLGGGLTTVIGYYFGSRSAQDAEASASLAIQAAQKTSDEARRRLEDQLAPTLDEDVLDQSAPPTEPSG